MIEQVHGHKGQDTLIELAQRKAYQMSSSTNNNSFWNKWKIESIWEWFRTAFVLPYIHTYIHQDLNKTYSTLGVGTGVMEVTVKSDLSHIKSLAQTWLGGRVQWLQSKAKCAAYILPHSASSTLWVVYKLIMQARHCPPPQRAGFSFYGPRKDRRLSQPWASYLGLNLRSWAQF